MAVPCVIELRLGERGEDRAQHVQAQGRSVFVVADGAGGVGGGAAAAQAVVDQAGLLAANVHSTAAQALSAADTGLAVMGSLSTGVIAVVHEGLLGGASCGDSAAWLIVDGQLIELTSGQHRKPLIGDGAVPVAWSPVAACGRLLLASDGLFNYTTREAILSAARMMDLASAAFALAELPRLSNGGYRDDVVVLLAQL